MINPILTQLVSAFRGGNGSNLQQMAMGLIQQSPMANTPMGQNLANLVKNGNGNEIINIVRNVSQQQGINFDQEFSNFKNNLGL